MKWFIFDSQAKCLAKTFWLNLKHYSTNELRRNCWAVFFRTKIQNIFCSSQARGVLQTTFYDVTKRRNALLCKKSQMLLQTLFCWIRHHVHYLSSHVTQLSGLSNWSWITNAVLIYNRCRICFNFNLYYTRKLILNDCCLNQSVNKSKN